MQSLQDDVREAEAQLARAMATKSVWSNDGDNTNDGQLIEAEAVLKLRRDALDGAVMDMRTGIAHGADLSSREHPLADVPFRGWIVSAGLVVVKALCWALCSVVHGRAPVESTPALPVPSAPPALPAGARRKRVAPSFNGGASKGGFVAGMVEKLRR